MLIFSILFFITSLCISAVGANDNQDLQNNKASDEKAIHHIQVQQEQIHKKLVHIEAQLTSPD